MSTQNASTRTRNDPFLVVAGLYLTIGALAAAAMLAVETEVLAPLPRLRWLTIHFVTIGGMTQALFGLLPSFAADLGGGTRSADRRHRRLQWLSLNAGYPLILFGMATGSTGVAAVGAAVVLGALLMLLATVYRVSAPSNGSHEPVRYLRTAPWYLVVGILAAFGMLLGIHGPGGYFGSIEAHVHANVWGFLALVVAGVLLAVLPRLFGADLRYPRLRGVTYWGITAGAAGLVAGPWLARHELTMLGLGVYVVGTVALLANVVGTYRAGDRTRTRRLALVLGAYLWLVFPVPWAPLVLLFPDTVPGRAIELAAINGLVFGWMLQLAMAFLPLVAVAAKRSSGIVAGMAGAIGNAPRPSWLRIGSVNAGMFLLWLVAFPPLADVADPLTLGGYFLITAAWGRFVVDLWRALIARPATRRHAGESASD